MEGPMDDERQMILRMLKEGKISLEEADALLQALAETGGEGRAEAEPSAGAGARPAPQAPPGPEEPGWTRTVRSEWSGLKDEIQGIIADMLKTVPQEVIHGIRMGTEPLRRGAFVELVQGLHGLPEADREISAEEPMDAGDTLAIRNRWGDVRLHAASDGRMRMTARVRVWAPTTEAAERTAGAIDITPHRVGSTVSLDVPRPEGARLRADLEIAVPQGVAVTVHAAKGDLRAAGLDGALRVEIASGDIQVTEHNGAVAVDVKSSDLTLRRITGDVRVDVKSGDVQLAEVRGRITGRVVSGDVEVDASGAAQLDVINGDVSLRRTTGDVAVETKSGDIDVEGVDGPAVRIRAISGDVTVRGAVRDTLQVDTLSGDILVALPPQTRATIDATTRSGEVGCRLPLVDRQETRRSLHGVLNGPGATVRLQALSGDIDIGEYTA